MMGEIAEWIQANMALTIALFSGAVAIWLLMPRGAQNRLPRLVGLAAGVVALLLGGFALIVPTGETTRDLVFYVFSAIAILSGVLTITSHYPVYAALWFALATLAVCGLFLLGSAPFLAAATVIVYAGAIVVTFLFVIMLAQQQGLAEYDRRAAQPFAATLVAMLLLGGVLSTLHPGENNETITANQLPPVVETVAANPLSRSDNPETDSMRKLGRSLFGDYLFAVEVAGTILMVAAIGAIAIVPKRSRGNL